MNGNLAVDEKLPQRLALVVQVDESLTGQTVGGQLVAAHRGLGKQVVDEGSGPALADLDSLGGGEPGDLPLDSEQTLDSLQYLGRLGRLSSAESGNEPAARMRLIPSTG